MEVQLHCNFWIIWRSVARVKSRKPSHRNRFSYIPLHLGFGVWGSKHVEKFQGNMKNLLNLLVIELRPFVRKSGVLITVPTELPPLNSVRYYFLIWQNSHHHPPSVGLGPPHSRSFYTTHNEAQQSVGLLWTSDQLFAETSTWQHTALATDRQTCPRWDSNPQPQKREAADPHIRPRGLSTILGNIKCDGHILTL